MKKQTQNQMKNHSACVAYRVEKVRGIYSRIGEPLPVDIIIDLYRHLGTALEQNERERPPRSGKKPRMQA